MRIGLVAISVCLLAAGAPEDIDGALARASKDNKRVLVVHGSEKLAETLKSPVVSRTILYEYVVVRVDAGEGSPRLTILGEDGKALAEKEKADSMAPEDLKAFLDEWKADPLDAEAVYAEALARAKREEKRLIVHLGAPW